MHERCAQPIATGPACEKLERAAGGSLGKPLDTVDVHRCATGLGHIFNNGWFANEMRSVLTGAVLGE
jgi:hypothetical protein